jgi:nucleoid-associated protein YgaU
VSLADIFHTAFSFLLPPKTYTVKAGDTLSQIAKAHYNDGSTYMKIYNANRDQLHDPDIIHPGQVLRIPR